MTLPVAQAREAARSTLTVLIVEDDAADAAAAKLLVSGKERPAFACARAASLAEAKLQIERRMPDLILLDLTLPDGSGVDALDSLQTLAPDAPILIFTNLDDEPTAVKALQ